MFAAPAHKVLPVVLAVTIKLNVIGVVSVSFKICEGIDEPPEVNNPVPVMPTGILHVQVILEPKDGEVILTKLLDEPEQIVWFAIEKLTAGEGLMVMVYVTGNPMQPSVVGVIV